MSNDFFAVINNLSLEFEQSCVTGDSFEYFNNQTIISISRKIEKELIGYIAVLCVRKNNHQAPPPTIDVATEKHSYAQSMSPP